MSSSSQAPESWISAFCSLVGHEYFAEVSEDFIEDDFNLTGLQSQVPMYKEALEMILDVEPEDLSDEEDENEDEDEDEDDMDQDGERGYRRPDAAERRHLRMASDLSVIESSAEMLYGLIHQRFITSRPGIQQMAEKYELGHFGHCPRVHCGGAKVLPVGCSDIPGQETVKLFCPSCLDVYNPPNSRFQAVDGAFFGTTFGCLFFMTFPELDPDMINGVAPRNLAPGLGLGNIYEPRIYGFRVSEFAKTGPRMKWLRSRPADVNELDECRIWAENQEAALQLPTDVGAAAADLPDSEMADEAIAGDNGEAEDEDMDRYGRGEPPGNVAPDSRAAYPTDATQRKKQSSAQGRRRDRHDVLPNGQGSGGGTALSVGGAG
ncbi:Casein kinase II subunit [Hortaea werneckii]|uniref:Casein kinase II subunit beta n=1 Tax=Hortaea werneckii EXF-2000 TaxID=1157616 RepID=A0A1Z5SZ17_HORWE|nr:Casein kinase II subunit [Hortaea werneckii]OTA27147.1 Casein kinase II subunit beta-1 [Hortaea werneckii EXF-2000]KAI6809985.1 Casein kinase II subunit [Hortaea werneckii]KAI6907870.1 Casein kinase II subunit [Hortaea werneckii]KAI6958448.1 Casein kinase II subunit [Hortaea werneckii]